MKPSTFAAVCLLPVLCCAFFLLNHLPGASTCVSSPNNPSRAASKDVAGVEQEIYLFPGLTKSSITAVSFITPERTFRFSCASPNQISVNGQKADAEIFSTLIEQLLSLPISPIEAFIPEEAPTLTLTVRTDHSEQSVSFYANCKGSSCARILCDFPPQYAQTDGWRIGTLLLACDGTRIQDAAGQETPL